MMSKQVLTDKDGCEWEYSADARVWLSEARGEAHVTEQMPSDYAPYVWGAKKDQKHTGEHLGHIPYSQIEEEPMRPWEEKYQQIKEWEIRNRWGLLADDEELYNIIYSPVDF